MQEVSFSQVFSYSFLVGYFDSGRACLSSFENPVLEKNKIEEILSSERSQLAYWLFRIFFVDSSPLMTEDKLLIA